MSEINVNDNPKPIIKRSKFGIFVGLVAVTGLCALGYVTVLSPYGVLQQQKTIIKLSNSVNQLLAKNNQLLTRLNTLESKENQTAIAITQLMPTQSGLILSQLNSLLNAVNQSVIVFHDYPSAIQLLQSAQKTLATTDDPLFTSLKVAVTNDLNNIQAKNNMDSTIIQSQLSNLDATVASLNSSFDTAEVVKPIELGNKWSAFWGDIKEKITGLVNVKKVDGINTSQTMLANDPMLIHKMMVLDIINLKRSLLIHNQEEWQTNLNEIRSLSQNISANNLQLQKILVIVGELQKLDVSGSVNIDSSLQALVKANQLYVGK